MEVRPPPSPGCCPACCFGPQFPQSPLKGSGGSLGWGGREKPLGGWGGGGKAGGGEGTAREAPLRGGGGTGGRSPRGVQGGDGDGCRGVHRSGRASQRDRRDPQLCPAPAQCPLPCFQLGDWDRGSARPHPPPCLSFPRAQPLAYKGVPISSKGWQPPTKACTGCKLPPGSALDPIPWVSGGGCVAE